MVDGQHNDVDEISVGGGGGKVCYRSTDVNFAGRGWRCNLLSLRILPAVISLSVALFRVRRSKSAWSTFVAMADKVGLRDFS